MIVTMTLQCRALLTGDSVSFLYPDLETGLQGRFVAATMLAAGQFAGFVTALTDTWSWIYEGQLHPSKLKVHHCLNR